MLPVVAGSQQSRLIRAMRRLKPQTSEVDLRVWLAKHQRELADMEFSRKQEKSWEPYMPGSTGPRSQLGSSFAPSIGGSVGMVRSNPVPQYPGEYHPNPTDVHSLTVANVKDMVANALPTSHMFNSHKDLMLRLPSLDYDKLEELVANLFPYLEREESNALLAKVIESAQLSPAGQSVENQISMKMTADMLHLQGFPQTFTAMMNAMGRWKNSKAFKVMQAREKFFGDLDFKWRHIQAIRKRSHFIGQKYLAAVPDVVDVVYELYKDYLNDLENDKIDEEKKKEVPITPREVHDPVLQYAYATGWRKNSEAIARIRENADGNGKMSINGSIPMAHFRGVHNAIEILLQPFDECDLNVYDFDVDLEVYAGGPMSQAEAARVAMSNALVKLLPHTKVYLNMASFLYPDPTMRAPKFSGEAGAPGHKYRWVKRGNPFRIW